MPFDQRGKNVNGKQYNAEGDQYPGTYYDHRHYVENVRGDKFGGDKIVGNVGNKAGRDIVNNYNGPVGDGQKIEDIAKLLDALKQQLVTARKQGSLDADTSTDAEDMVNKALQQTKKPEPDKKRLLMYLETAKGFLEGVATAGGVVASLVDVAEIVRRLL